MKVFVASPLFNPPQKERIKEILHIIGDVGLDSYQCERDGIVIDPKVDLPERLRSAFMQDVYEAQTCDVMVVNLDYHLPDGQELRIAGDIESRPDGWSSCRLFSPALHLPDAGTVWEAATAFANRKIVIGLQTLSARANLMLAQGCHFYVRSLKGLRACLLSLRTMTNMLSREHSDGCKALAEFIWARYHTQRPLQTTPPSDDVTDRVMAQVDSMFRIYTPTNDVY